MRLAQNLLVLVLTEPFAARGGLRGQFREHRKECTRHVWDVPVRPSGSVRAGCALTTGRSSATQSRARCSLSYCPPKLTPLSTTSTTPKHPHPPPPTATATATATATPPPTHTPHYHHTHGTVFSSNPPTLPHAGYAMTYLVRFFLRSRSSASALCFSSFALSCRQQRSIARFTAAFTSGMSSPMYSLPVPLNGTFVLTKETKMPILSWC